MTPFNIGQRILVYRFGKKQWGFGILRSFANFRVAFLKWEMVIFNKKSDADTYNEGFQDGIADNEKSNS